MVRPEREETIVRIEGCVSSIKQNQSVKTGQGYWFWGTITRKWHKKNPNKTYLMWCRSGFSIECFDPDRQEKKLHSWFGRSRSHFAS